MLSRLLSELQQIEQIHVLAALLRQEEGLIPQLLKQMGITVESLDAAVMAEVRKLPQVTTMVPTWEVSRLPSTA